jgi:ankyrin repeat protein
MHNLLRQTLDTSEIEPLFTLYTKANLLLFAAVQSGGVCEVRKVATQHPRLINLVVREGMAPLHAAALTRNVKIVEELVKMGASVDLISARRNTPTALHLAVICSAPVSAALIRLGAQLESRDACGQTPLFWAVFGTESECVQQLIEAGADLNARNAAGDTPLHLARSAANTRHLLDAGADPTRVNDELRDALHVAAQGQDQVVEELLKDARMRERINSTDKIGFFTPLPLPLPSSSLLSCTLSSLSSLSLLSLSLSPNMVDRVYTPSHCM